MKILSVRKVAQGTALAIVLTFYTSLFVVLWPGLRTDGTQDGAAHEGSSSSAAAKVVLLRPAPGFQERAPRSIAEGPGDNTVDYPGGDSGGANAGEQYNDGASSSRVKTAPNRTTELEDIFLSVKTTKSFHQSRLDVILKTWFVLARDQTYFFSDADDPLYQMKTNGHLINTNCSSSHNRKALCCKMSVEFDYFLDSTKKWFCHFDDDNYVNVPRLVRLLQKYNPQEDWYLGKPSIRAPLEIVSRDSGQKISFWFATGGAGFCLSRALAFKMLPIAGGGKFISIGEKIRLPDDVTMGYIIEHLLKKHLTVVEHFHSHLEPMKFIKKDSLSEQITFSYSRFNREMNVLSVDGFDSRVDPTRFLSLHCHLFPNFSFCPR